MISLEQFFNVYNTHHAPLTKPQKLPKLLPKFADVLRVLNAISKNDMAHRQKIYLDVIVKATDDALEQYALLLFYYKCRGIRAPNHHNYNKVGEAEKQFIHAYHQMGLSKYAIAKFLGRHVSTVYYVLKSSLSVKKCRR